MSRNIELHPLSGKATIMTVRKEFDFLAGGTERKSIVEGTVGRHRVSLIKRKDIDGRYEANWCAFREAGLPVVRTLRRGEERSIFLTDVKADGSETYGSNLKYVLRRNHKRSRARPEIDRIFVGLINPADFRKITDRVAECASIASENHILLPPDDPFDLVVHPDSSWDIVLLDLEFGKVVSTHNKNIKRDNLINGQRFLDDLAYVAGALRGSL
ncbi:MAG TPA: hypothetical protein VNA13_03670 [Xanthomonadales bacterium]|nr:hypothetical protein [Xanthomonadales bacterium]